MTHIKHDEMWAHGLCPPCIDDFSEKQWKFNSSLNLRKFPTTSSYGSWIVENLDVTVITIPNEFHIFNQIERKYNILFY